ncbi:hypothetical protein ACP275_08G208500 [Erythranthe tilingii]
MKVAIILFWVYVSLVAVAFTIWFALRSLSFCEDFLRSRRRARPPATPVVPRPIWRSTAATAPATAASQARSADVEMGRERGGGTKDGDMVVLGGVAGVAVVAVADAAAGDSDGGGGGCGGDCGGGCGGDD